jgi:hypothetical protein
MKGWAMITSSTLQAMVISSDPHVLESMPGCLKTIGIEAVVHREIAPAIDQMTKHKTDAFFVDRDCDPEFSFLQRMRATPSNRRAIGFAIVGEGHPAAFRLADFIVHKPMLQPRVTQTLRAAYGIMLNERRRYFRKSVQMPATLLDSANRAVKGKTVNISQNGFAMDCEEAPKHGELLKVTFAIPDRAELLNCTGQVVWSHCSGRTGLAITKIGNQDREFLARWLDLEFQQQHRLPPAFQGTS